MENIKLIDRKEIAFEFLYVISLTDRMGCREGEQE